MKNKVYFAAVDDRIKIGTSENVEQRLQQINSFLLEPIRLIGTVDGSYPLEAALHERFSKFRIKGEWFSDCDELRALIRLVLRFGPQTIGLKPAALISRPKSNRHADGLEDVGLLLERARQVWPVKTAHHLAVTTGSCLRTTKYWLCGRRLPNAAAAFAIAYAINAAGRRSGKGAS
jgi:hydrogenase maturation factor HypE